MLSLSNQQILVTGASSGLGRAIAQTCASAGAAVIGCGRDETRLAEMLNDLPGQGHGNESVDLLAVSIVEWMKDLAQRRGPISGVVHSAGVLVTKPLRMVSEGDWERSWKLNVTVGASLVRALHQKDVKGAQANVVFLSSVMALVGQPGQSVYGATKGAVAAMTRSLALEYAKDGTRINCVAPAVVETPMTGKLRDSMLPESFEQIVKMHPLGLGQPADVANAVAFLLSPMARWITGTTLVVDGGYTAH